MDRTCSGSRPNLRAGVRRCSGRAWKAWPRSRSIGAAISGSGRGRCANGSACSSGSGCPDAMANPFESASWFQVARLRPRLKTNVRVRRHRYRGMVQYVLDDGAAGKAHRSEEHTSELQSLMRTSYAVLCLKKEHKEFQTTHQLQETNLTM